MCYWDLITFESDWTVKQFKSGLNIVDIEIVRDFSSTLSLLSEHKNITYIMNIGKPRSNYGKFKALLYFQKCKKAAM